MIFPLIFRVLDFFSQPPKAHKDFITEKTVVRSYPPRRELSIEVSPPYRDKRLANFRHTSLEIATEDLPWHLECAPKLKSLEQSRFLSMCP